MNSSKTSRVEGMPVSPANAVCSLLTDDEALTPVNAEIRCSHSFSYLLFGRNGNVKERFRAVTSHSEIL
jgi:hypothetical protein